MPEGNPRELDHVDLDPTTIQSIQQRFHQLLGFMAEEKRAEDQVDTDDADGLLLGCVVFFHHPHMDNDLAVLVARVRLEADPHPAMAVVGAVIVASRNGIRKGKKSSRISARFPEPIQVELVLMGQHIFQSLARDVPSALAVDRVTDRHVVGRHALGDRPGRTADLEEPSHHFLSGPNFSERTVTTLIQVNQQSLAFRLRSTSIGLVV